MPGRKADSGTSSKTLADVVHTLGQDLLDRFGHRIHKVALDTGFTCPNRDGTVGRGGCTFCNNETFAPGAGTRSALEEQIRAGREVVGRRTGARHVLAYFQAYTNTYDRLEVLQSLWDRALGLPGVVGISVGTRPDCLPEGVLEALARRQDKGYEVWLELGLQSIHEATLRRVNRGHGPQEWWEAHRRARTLGLKVCTHLILGLPGEGREEILESHRAVVAEGSEGLKIHPLHIVRGSLMANQWRRGEVEPISLSDYATWAADLVERTPWSTVFHRLTGTASENLLLAPLWCARKWTPLNAIERELRERGSRQGARAGGLR